MNAVTVREAYLTRRQLADQLGLSVRKLGEFTAQGMPCHRWGMTRTVRYRLSEVVAWLEQREQADAIGTIPVNCWVAIAGRPTQRRE